MASVIYVGPSDAVEIPSLGIIAERGVAFEADDEAAASLLMQDVYKAAPKAAITSSVQKGDK